MKQIKKILIFLVIFSIFIIPVLSFAWNIGDPIVPKCSTDGCGWTEFLTLVNNFIQFILKALVIPIAAIMFFYAGFKLVISGGSTEAKTQAKKIFTSAVIGLLVAAGAWLIIHTILSILNPTAGYWSWIGL